MIIRVKKTVIPSPLTDNLKSFAGVQFKNMFKFILGSNLRANFFPGFLLVLIFLVLCVFIASLHAQTTNTDDSSPLQMVGTLKAKKITESSGLAASHFIEDAYWTMNDSGNGSVVYLFGDAGQTLAECKVKDSQNKDWEAMSSFQRNDKHYLLVADVGDNVARRTRCELYVFEEPKFKPRKKKSYSKKLKATKIEFTYQDGSRNCEAVACEPDGSAVYFVEKIFLENKGRRNPGVYKLSLPQATFGPMEEDADPPVASPAIAKRVAEFPFRGVTGMAISPNGNRLAIRNYLSAHLFERESVDGVLPSWETTFKNTKPRVVPMPLQIQGEAICFSRDNEHLIVTSEMARQPIWKVRVSSKE